MFFSGFDVGPYYNLEFRRCEYRGYRRFPLRRRTVAPERTGFPGALQTLILVPAIFNRGLRMGHKLRSGEKLPSLTLNLVGGGSVTLPDDIESDFAVVLFYRGHW